MVNRLPLCRLVILLLGAILLPFPSAGEEGGPVPVATLREARALAAADRRLVFVELMAWDCPHCRAFEKQVLDSKTFRDYASRSLHLVFYDIKRQSQMSEEQRSEVKELIREHLVRFTPTILVFSPDGALLLETTGYKVEDRELHDSGAKLRDEFRTFEQRSLLREVIPPTDGPGAEDGVEGSGFGGLQRGERKQH